jgi:hypothetical protein
MDSKQYRTLVLVALGAGLLGGMGASWEGIKSLGIAPHAG